MTARYLAPPTALVAVAAGTAAGLLGVATGIRPLAAGFVLPAGYAATILLGSLRSPGAGCRRPRGSVCRWCTPPCTAPGRWAS